MEHPVMIKGNKYGIRLVLDSDMAFDELLAVIGGKFEEAERFFRGNANLALTIDGRVLSNEELDRLLSEVQKRTDLNISYIIDESDMPKGETDQAPPAPEIASQWSLTAEENEDDGAGTAPDGGESAYRPAESVMPPRMVYENKETLLSNDSMFYKGTLRSGQALESDGSIVVLGDVNPGASVISSGNIIVIGRLKGMVHAGATGNTNAFVLALSMNPVQIRIADAIARSADRPKRRIDDEAKLAFLEDGNIYIEPVKKSVLNNIHI